MDKSDQKYLLNSEILVIVQHMMMKRHRELESERKMKEFKDGDTDHSYVSTSGSSRAESPELAGSDLCDSDVDTDDLVCSNTDTDTESPKHQVNTRIKPPLKKKGSFFRFMISRAQQWKKRKSEKTGSNSIERQQKMNGNSPISTVCDVTGARDVVQDEVSDNNAWPTSSVDINTIQTDPQATILDPRNFTNIEQNSCHRMEPSRIEDYNVEQLSQNKQSESIAFLKPPGLTIPKVGYFGLSEGNIPQAMLKAVSEESINRVLSEQNLLGDYLKDMSHLCNPEKDIPTEIPNIAVRQTVRSMENLSLTCSSVEMFSEALQKSLLELREVTGGLDEDLESLINAHGNDDDNRRTSLFIEEEDDEEPQCMAERAPLASTEETPEFCRKGHRRSCEGTPSHRGIIETITQYIWRVPETS